MKGELFLTQDGTSSLRHSLLGDSYHSEGGAVSESLHVYIDAGFNSLDKNHISIFEMGFGTGLNCALTLFQAIRNSVSVDYHSVELYPIDQEVVRELNYFKGDARQRELFETLHRVGWNHQQNIVPGFTLTKYHNSLENVELNRQFDLIYFDAFAYDTQPELWSVDIFRRIASATVTRGVLVTYSSKGVVKQALRDAGFEVKRLAGACGKHHMLRAVKL
jgi:tRNA U34 5-methylaminomethyl-2-thiouridine-forming methyltransferase MnmC